MGSEGWNLVKVSAINLSLIKQQKEHRKILIRCQRVMASANFILFAIFSLILKIIML